MSLWLSWWLRWLLLPSEGDLYFTAKLQNYTAVEKDEAVLSCELSRASGEVTWFKGDAEVFPSKNIVVQSDGRKRQLLIKKVTKNDAASYSCDCVTDRTTADLTVEGNHCRVSRQDSGPAHLQSSASKLLPPFVSVEMIHCDTANKFHICKRLLIKFSLLEFRNKSVLSSASDFFFLFDYSDFRLPTVIKRQKLCFVFFKTVKKIWSS